MQNLAHLPDYLNHSLTVSEKKSVWADGEPLPCLTYPAICYLEQLNLTRQFVFEYGCGFSTLYWAKRALKVTSVEHNEHRYHVTRAELPENVDLFLATERSYIESIERNAPHNVIVIDGDWRPDCVAHCLPYLTEEGMIVLDDSERYPELTAVLRDKSLIQVDFFGHGPINTHMWVTSIFLARGFRVEPRKSVRPHYLPGVLHAADNPALE